MVNGEWWKCGLLGLGRFNKSAMRKERSPDTLSTWGAGQPEEEEVHARCAAVAAANFSLSGRPEMEH